MKMAAAADKATNKTGSSGLLRMTLPTATTHFPFESLIFSSQSFAHAAENRTSELRRGSYGWRPRLTVMINRKDYYGRNCNPHFWFRRGYLWKCEHVRMDFCRCFPAGRAISAEWGVEATTMWSCPD